MMLGVAGRRPKYWWDLGQSIDSDLGGLLGTHVRNSNGLYTNPTTGLITTVGNNIPRFERQGGHLALLDEPEGTNLIHFSHELGNVASGGWWSDSRLTSVTADGMLAPDGNTVADGLVADVNDNTHSVNSSNIAGAAQNDKVVLTVFAKPGNKDWVQLYIRFYDAADGDLGDFGSYFFNVATGAIGIKSEVGDITIHDYKIEQAAYGFYKIGIIGSNADINTAKVQGRLVSAHADNDNTFPGDTTTVNTWFWGADLKEQAYFDSYVPTSGATASRATESGYPLWTLPAGLFNAQGTCSVWVRFGYPSTVLPGGSRGIIAVRDFASSLLYTNSAKLMTYDGINDTGIDPFVFSANTWYKAVVKWSSTTLKMRVGYDSGAGIVWGAEVAFDGSYTLGASLRLAFGLYGPMWLRDLRLYDIVLTDTMINATGSP